MKRHRIYLRGPWEFRRLSNLPERTAVDELPDVAVRTTQGRIHMPTSWQTVFGTVGGRILFVRRFGRPTNLDTGERVFLVCHGLQGRATVSLNGTVLGTIDHAPESIDFEVTELLEPRNELTLDLEFEPPVHGETQTKLWTSVAIEIEH